MNDVVVAADAATVELVAERFDRLGVLVITGFCDPAIAAQAAAEVDAVVAKDPGREPTFGDTGYDEQRFTRARSWALGHCKELIPTCRTILRDPRLPQWADAICGPDHKRQPGSITSTFEGDGQAWHQDSRDPHPRHFTLNRIVFAAEIAPEQGCLVVVPGSHRTGDLPEAEPYSSLSGEMAIAPPAGSVVLMHSRCFHKVERNTTTKPRTQFNGRVLPAECPDDITAYPFFSTGPWNFRTGRPE